MNPTALIIDGSLTARMDLDDAFRSSGFHCELCADAAGARRALEALRLDVIILDAFLPDGDGLLLLKELRAQRRTASVPVILLSSEAEVSDRIRGLETGATDYIGKPYDRTYVVARARELLRRSDPGGALDASANRPLVLLVDDSVTVRQELREALEHDGFEVVETGTGEDGVRIAFDRRPAAAIIDGMLPQMDGAMVVRQLRSDAVLRRTPCILLTAAEERLGELTALEEGADAYVRKGEGLEVVLARLHALLRAGRPSAPPRARSVLGPKRILVVDDSATYLEDVSSHLRQDNYDIVQASSGPEALRLLAHQEVDCILMDLSMPEMSGQQACRAIKSDPALREIPLVVITVREDRAAMLEAIATGADDFVVKSSPFQVLRARLRAQLRRTQFEHESRMLAEHERFEQAAEILETVPDAFFAVDGTATILYANEPALRLIDRQRVDARGTSLRAALAELTAPSSHDQLEQALASRTPSQFLVQFCAPDEPWFEVRAFPRDRGFILYLRNVTERVRAEDALREADQRKNEFLAVLSHELRNPLAPIRNSLYVLGRATPGGEQARRAQLVIDRQVSHLTTLVNDLLDVTRIARNKIRLRKELLDLNEVVHRAVEDNRSSFDRAKVELRLIPNSIPIHVHADSTRLAQIVGNLLQNAAKFTRPGGHTHVQVGTDGKRARVQVIDDGVGMAPDTLGRLFQPFMQAEHTLDRSKGGLGLGLALIKGLLDQHGGSISAHSDGLGKGATFIVHLPLADAPAGSIEHPPSHVAAGSGRRVLIIEDNTDSANSLKEALELGDNVVAVAYDGPEGLAKAREFRPEVVFCDIGLPGMDGYEVAHAFREDARLATAHLVALSGYALPDDLTRASEAGFEEHLAKPARIDQLQQLLDALPR